MTPVQRQTARILPVDPRGCVLLLFGRDPARPSSPYWFTVGGGIDEGETARDAAVREMREETGIRVENADLMGPLDRLLHSNSYAGQDFVSDSTFFAAAVDHTEISRAGLDQDEAANILEAAWWAPDDLVAAPLQPGLPLLELARAAVAVVARSGAETDEELVRGRQRSASSCAPCKGSPGAPAKNIVERGDDEDDAQDDRAGDA